MAPRDYMTIGEVVERLSAAYPDLTISKVRFLEEEGLVSPERTPGGYRKFSQGDVQRVELILMLQREHFLPLAVIGQRLADFDRGKSLPELEGLQTTSVTAVSTSDDETGPMPLDETQSTAGIPATFIKELAEKLTETLAELQQLTADLKARLLRRALRQAFDDDLG